MATVRFVLAMAVVAIIVTLVVPSQAGAETALVRGVLFYDPSCGNCEAVMANVLPPLEARYGERLRMYRLDVSTLVGFDAWLASTKHFEVPAERKGVPLLVVGEQLLSGEDEIAAMLPGTIEKAIAAGGEALPHDLGFTEANLVAWEALSDSMHAAEPEPDTAANALAIMVLLGMMLSVVYIGATLWRGAGTPSDAGLADGWRHYVVPVLAVLGMVVAGYLSYVKLVNSSAICPIGSCNAVQHSQWAQLLGVPVAYLGFLSYAGVLALWLWGAVGSGPLSRLASIGVFAMAIVGTLFSIYLTFLEPFVIKEVCVWCLASAVLMTLILLVSFQQLAPVEISLRNEAPVRLPDGRR